MVLKCISKLWKYYKFALRSFVNFMKFLWNYSTFFLDDISLELTFPAIYICTGGPRYSRACKLQISFYLQICSFTLENMAQHDNFPIKNSPNMRIQDSWPKLISSASNERNLCFLLSHNYAYVLWNSIFKGIMLVVGRCQFHQHFKSSFYHNILAPKK